MDRALRFFNPASSEGAGGGEPGGGEPRGGEPSRGEPGGGDPGGEDPTGSGQDRPVREDARTDRELLAGSSDLDQSRSRSPMSQAEGLSSEDEIERLKNCHIFKNNNMFFRQPPDHAIQAKRDSDQEGVEIAVQLPFML